MTMNKIRFTSLTAMILAVVAARWLPHVPNFTPVTALALFGGASFGDKRLAFIVPLLGLFLSDLVLGFYSITPLVYVSFALVVGLGLWLRHRKNLPRITFAAIVGALLFFVVTNFGVWALDGLYPRTLAGLGECYLAAVPFFCNTLASSLLYSTLLFGGWALAEKRWPTLAEAAPAAV
jgi:hypothetical protein